MVTCMLITLFSIILLQFSSHVNHAATLPVISHCFFHSCPLCLSFIRVLFSKMAKEDDEQTRLHECVRKYRVMVKQFDELIEIMNTKTKLPKRRKSSVVPPGSAIQPDSSNEALVQTITRFFHELNPNPNPNPTHPNCSTSK